MTILANRYALQAPLGTGATGAVYRALDQETGRLVALKRLTATDEAARALFRHEFHALRRFAQPGLVAAYDWAETEEGPFFTMELIDGPPLPAGPLAAEEAGAILVGLARTLAGLHAAGVVHGDLKPDNARFDAEGRLRLLDLGFLQMAGRPGARRGTPEYMAPEVIRGEPADPRSDLYALGAIGYALLAGRLPFEAADPLALLRRQLESAPEELQRLRPELPARLCRAVMACLAKAPADRPLSAGHFLAASGLGEAETAYLLFGSQVFGRELAIAELANQLREQLAGLAPALTVTGPEGIGKSRLLVAVSAAMPDVPALTASGSADVPFGLVTALVASAEGLMPSAGLAPGDDAWKALRALVPGWGEPPAPLDPRNQENRLRQALARLLAALAAGAGLVIALDDWHRADAASRDLLAPLLSGPAVPKVGWVLAQPAPAEGPEQALGPLARESVEALLATALAGPLPPGLLDLASDRSGGNPAHLRDLLGFWTARGALAFAHGAWRFEPAAAQDLALDSGSATALHLGGLSPGALEVGQAAAVLGHGFDLAQLLRLYAGDPFAGLAELEAAGLVLRRGDRAGFLGTAHEALLATLGEPEAIRWHRRAAALYAGATDLAGLTRSAHHHLHGRTDEAPEAALAAARAHLALGALGTAQALLLALPEALPPVHDLERSRLLGDLGRMRGAGAEALARYEAAIALATSLGDDSARCRDLVSAGRTAMMLSDAAAARRYLDQALPLARSLGHAAQEARALMTLGRLSFFAGAADAARADYEAALAVAEKAGEDGLKADALSFLGVMAPAGSEAGQAYLQAAVALHRALANPLGLIDASINLGDRRLAAGDLSGAEAVFDEALAVCRQVGSRNEEAFVLLNLAQTYLEQGRPEAASDAAGRAYDLAAGLTQWYPAGYARVLAALAGLELGRYEEAREAVLEGLDLASETGNKYLEAAARAAEAQVLVETGDAEGAERATAALLEASPEDPRALWLRGRALLLRGRFAEARSPLEAGLAAAEAAGARFQAARSTLALGRAALAEGDPASARALSERALDRALALGASGLTTEARWLNAESRRLSGEDARALFAQVAESALPLLRALGLLGLAQTTTGGEAARARQEARRALRALEAAARPGDFFGWSERRLEEEAEAPAGIDDLMGLLGVLEQAGSYRELLDGLLAKLLAVSEAEAGGLFAFRDMQLSDYALSGLSEQKVGLLPEVDEALWSRRPLVEADHWALPVVSDETVIAVVYLEAPASGRQALTEALLGGVRFALDQFLALQGIQTQVERLAFSESLARLALAGPAPEAVRARVLAAVLDATRGERAFLLDAALETLVALDHQGRALAPDAPLSRSVSRHVAETGESVRLLDPQTMDQWQKQQSILALGLQMIIAVPLRREGAVTGVLYVDSANVASLLGPREQGLAEAAAEILALVL